MKVGFGIVPGVVDVHGVVICVQGLLVPRYSMVAEPRRCNGGVLRRGDGRWVARGHVDDKDAFVAVPGVGQGHGVVEGDGCGEVVVIIVVDLNNSILFLSRLGRTTTGPHPPQPGRAFSASVTGRRMRCWRYACEAIVWHLQYS